MKKRIYVKNKSFLKHFITIAVLLLSITVGIVISVYRMSLRALEQEIKNLNQNLCYEMNDRLKGILEQSNQFAAHLVTDDKVQLFFTHERPEYLVENYYAELDGKMRAYGISYIDSVLLYAPKYEKFFAGGENEQAYTISEIAKNNAKIFDISWMDHMDTQERTTTKIFTRAKADRWPYYITVMKQYRSGTLDGIALININLADLYEELIAGRDESVQIYIVDEEQRVILKENKRELFTPLAGIESLSDFTPQSTFCKIRNQGDSRYAYAQVYSEEYGLTCVVLSALEDYTERITQVQKRFIEIAFAAAAVAIFLACLYSMKLIRPLQDIRMLLDNSAKDKEMKYSEEIRDIAEQIMRHLQTNGALREELDRRLALLKNTQMVALRSQINPHFLFNTLNVIKQKNKKPERTAFFVYADGSGCLYYYSALVGIDNALFEAAELGGANVLQKCWHIAIPSLIPIMTMMTILGIGHIFSGDMGLFYQVTQNQGTLYPTTDIINTYTYRALLDGSLEKSSAVGLFQSGTGLVLVLAVNALVRKISPENSMF